MLECCELCEIERLEQILQTRGDEINLRLEDEKGQMAIHKLARKGACSALVHLLEKWDPSTLDLDVNAVDKDGYSPIFHATTPQSFSSLVYQPAGPRTTR